MKQILALLLCAGLLATALTGCNQDETVYIPTGNGLSDGYSYNQPATPSVSADQELTLLYDASATMNPYECTSYTNRVLFSLMYQGLFTVDKSYNVTPMLCDSYIISADMKAYTFYIAAARYSDGTAVTAEDVAASLNAARESTWYSGRLQHVVDVSAYGDAVVVELDTAMEDLPILLDIPIVKASQVSSDAPLGTGPYRMDGDRLKRVAGWWCSGTLSVSSDTITLVASGTAAENRDSFELGGVSLVCADPSKATSVDYHSDYELWECENGLFLYLGFNSESTVFSNEAVRAALTYGIDRDSLVENYYGGFARSALLPCSPLSPLYNSNLAVNYSYDPDRLRSVLEQEGLLGSKITLLLNGDDTTRVRVGNAIKEMLEACGLVVTLRESTSETFADDLKGYKKKDSYDLYLAQTRLSANMDLSAFFAPDGSLNYGGMTSGEVYQISLEALANAGNYYTLYERVMDGGLLCPILFQSYAIYGQRGLLSSLSPARDNIFWYDLGHTMEEALAKGSA